MTLVLTALLFAVLVWWAGTAVVLVLQHRLQGPDSLLVGSVLAGVSAASLMVLAAMSDQIHAVAHFMSFVAGVVLWGCVELSYFLGLITGTHNKPCPAGLNNWQRFCAAVSTSIWHELSVICIGVALFVLLHGTSNPTGLNAFLVLWFMRWSAKLNLFFGVPHFATNWFPSRMSHLGSYIRRSPVSVFYVVSMIGASAALVFLLLAAGSAEGSSSLAFGLPAALLLLAIAEHGCMALPVSDSRLWNRVFDPSATSRRAAS